MDPTVHLSKVWLPMCKGVSLPESALLCISCLVGLPHPQRVYLCTPGHSSPLPICLQLWSGSLAVPTGHLWWAGASPGLGRTDMRMRILLCRWNISILLYKPRTIIICKWKCKIYTHLSRFWLPFNFINTIAYEGPYEAGGVKVTKVYILLCTFCINVTGCGQKHVPHIVYMHNSAHNITSLFLFLLAATVRSTPMMIIDRMATTIKTEIATAAIYIRE